MHLGRMLWRLAVNPVTFVVICLLWCLDLGLGSLLAYQRPDIFGAMDAYPFAAWLREVGRRNVPWSAWVYLLVVLSWLMTTSLALCTANWFWRRRTGLRGLGEVLVHLGFLLIFSGFVSEAVLGTRVHGVLVGPGDEATIQPLGLSLRLEKIDLTTSLAGDVLDTVSTLVVRRGAQSAAGTSRLNHPLIAGSTVVYPRGFQRVISAVWLLTPGGALRLEPGDSSRLSDGRRLVLRGVLQPDEERGGLRGPAVDVGLVDSAGQQLQSAVLAPGRGSGQAVISGMPVALERFEDRLLGRYDVHRDPGVRLVLLGAVLLGAGTLWAFGMYVAGPGRGRGSPDPRGSSRTADSSILEKTPGFAHQERGLRDQETLEAERAVRHG